MRCFGLSPLLRISANILFAALVALAFTLPASASPVSPNNKILARGMAVPTGDVTARVPFEATTLSTERRGASGVLSLRDSLKVRGIYAGPVPAQMVNMKIGRNVAFEPDKRNTVRSVVDTFQAKSTVALGQKTLPQPATGMTFDSDLLEKAAYGGRKEIEVGPNRQSGDFLKIHRAFLSTKELDILKGHGCRIPLVSRS